MPDRFPIFYVSPKCIRLISFCIPLSIEAITLGPIVISRNPLDECVRRHEKIHYLQYKELFFLGFLVMYIWDFFRGYLLYKNWHKAYRRIRFEQEAYEYMFSNGYVQERERYAWRNYSVYTPDL
jgi:hypothetical protein